MAERTALVLSGGGARGAYQVGVIRGLLEIGALGDGDPAFDVLVGSSAGAINAAMLAARADEIRSGVEDLERIWTSIEPAQVFRTDLRSLGGIGARWVRDLSFGGLVRRVAPKSLLDTSPLRKLLADHIPFDRIDRNIEANRLRALAMPATDLYTSDGILFLDTKPEVPLWRRGRWSVERTPIGVEHVMASSAIPVFFPSVQIDGRHLGDGSVRNTAPLSPAINLGADRIVAIGVRQPSVRTGKVRRANPPSLAQVAGALLDAVMLDAIGIDVEHSERVNQSVVAAPNEDGNFRRVDVLWLSPQRHFHEIAAQFADRIPAIIRYLMRGLGSDEETTELASYLLFDSAYCRRLVEIGYDDVLERRSDVEAFLAGDQPEVASKLPSPK